MSKRLTMPAMMAWQMEPMPLTMAIRQAPMVWKTDLIYLGGLLVLWLSKDVFGPEDWEI